MTRRVAIIGNATRFPGVPGETLWQSLWSRVFPQTPGALAAVDIPAIGQLEWKSTGKPWKPQQYTTSTAPPEQSIAVNAGTR